MNTSYNVLAAIDIDVDKVDAALTELHAYMNEHAGQHQAVWSYLIPELGEGGSCSLFGALQQEPFSLASQLGNDKAVDNALSHLQSIVKFIESKTNVDWFGIYQTRVNSEGSHLLKLAYLGAPSRPIFPLTSEFAKISNNVQVGLRGKGRIINDVDAYVSQGGEYYTCDPKVKSEVCLPLYNAHNQCIGIIDAESFNKDFFTEQQLAYFVAACIKIPQYLPA